MLKTFFLKFINNPSTVKRGKSNHRLLRFHFLFSFSSNWEHIYQRLKTVSDHISKNIEFLQKIFRCASYFQLSPPYLETWSNTAFCTRVDTLYVQIPSLNSELMHLGLPGCHNHMMWVTSHIGALLFTLFTMKKGSRKVLLRLCTHFHLKMSYRNYYKLKLYSWR